MEAGAGPHKALKGQPHKARLYRSLKGLIRLLRASLLIRLFKGQPHKALSQLFNCPAICHSCQHASACPLVARGYLRAARATSSSVFKTSRVRQAQLTGLLPVILSFLFPLLFSFSSFLPFWFLLSFPFPFPFPLCCTVYDACSGSESAWSRPLSQH